MKLICIVLCIVVTFSVNAFAFEAINNLNQNVELRITHKSRYFLKVTKIIPNTGSGNKDSSIFKLKILDRHNTTLTDPDIMREFLISELNYDAIADPIKQSLEDPSIVIFLRYKWAEGSEAKIDKITFSHLPAKDKSSLGPKGDGATVNVTCVGNSNVEAEAAE